MPTYEYECKKCKYSFEQFQSMKDDPLKRCPECGKNTLVRLIGTGAGIIFKGSGFYETDYRSDTYKKSAEKEKSTPSSSDSSSASGKDSAGSGGDTKKTVKKNED